ncbi:5794_t:CDS:2 [Acaulospora morrowiae]|uniref:5794_t:CDS:1 n=1 Tax=Acaulospora morrowiae TaxID=94023 RepID=A0A9N9BUG0_9GLOM|nr:5794_t:CDS:2 [Acaulospora morrowiae]
MSASASPPKKRRLSTSPADERRVSINEPPKKIKQENSNGSGNSGNSVKSESFSPKMMSLTTQQSKASGPIVRALGATHPLNQNSTSSIPTFSSDVDKEKESASTVQSLISSIKGKGSNNNQAHLQSSSTSSSHQSQTQSQIPETQLSQQSPQELQIRLTKKEEEIQNLLATIIKFTLLGELHNLSQTLTPDFTFDQSLRKKFLDPAINALFRAMKKESEEKEKTIENLQRELTGVSFTPNSITGKKLVTKLKALQDENEELGRQLRQGRVEQYEVEIAMQRKLINELRHGLEDYENQSIAFDSEIERLQDLIFQLQSKLKHYEKKFGPLVSANKEHATEDTSKSVITTGEETEPIDVSSKET